MPRKKKYQAPPDIGPLARLSSMCDEMEDLIAPGAKWYPQIIVGIRRLDYTIRWEIDRLRWEISFMEITEAERAEYLKPNRKRFDRDALEGIMSVSLGTGDE